MVHAVGLIVGDLPDNSYSVVPPKGIQGTNCLKLHNQLEYEEWDLSPFVNVEEHQRANDDMPYGLTTGPLLPLAVYCVWVDGPHENPSLIEHSYSRHLSPAAFD